MTKYKNWIPDPASLAGSAAAGTRLDTKEDKLRAVLDERLCNR